MANICLYSIKAVSKSKESLERLESIMNYKDKEYYIYRCFSAEFDIYQDGEFYIANISGTVAYSCNKWFETQENKNELVFVKYDENRNPIFGTSHYITLDLLCQILDIGLELYSKETGCCFQEHYLVNHLGEFIFNESKEWREIWCDDDGNELDEPKEIGGFDYYGEFSFSNEIYG